MYYTPPNTQQVRICISGDLVELPRNPDAQIAYSTMGIGASIVFTAKSVERVQQIQTLANQPGLNIYLKTVEEWQRENA